MKDDLIPKIACLLLSGGAGTRLWPMSTEKLPKQFLPLIGDRSLYQRTLERVSKIAVDGVWVVANSQHTDILNAQAAAIGVPLPQLVLEPERRDSAPAIAAGVSAVMAHHGPDTVIIVLPCDHMIQDQNGFARTMAEGVKLASLGQLGTFGIVPTFPSTEFGYLQSGDLVDGPVTANKVLKFHEKPQSQTAAGYLAEGGYYWNSGMFIFTAASFTREGALHMPDILAAAEGSVRNGTVVDGIVTLDATWFAEARKTSIDYALFEKSDRVALIKAEFDWSDVGSWSAVATALEQDATGNVTKGTVALLDVDNSLIVANGVRVLASGVSGLLIVATPEGIFIAPKDRASDVKALLGMDAQSAKG